jgi:hypothetical protein
MSLAATYHHQRHLHLQISTPKMMLVMVLLLLLLLLLPSHGAVSQHQLPAAAELHKEDSRQHVNRCTGKSIQRHLMAAACRHIHLAHMLDSTGVTAAAGQHLLPWHSAQDRASKYLELHLPSPCLRYHVRSLQSSQTPQMLQ